MSYSWSDQQLAILNWFQYGTALDRPYKNLVARARAGTGKSTTIEEGTKRAPEKAILIAAFSKIIQLAGEARFTEVLPTGQKIRRFPHIKVQTLHSVGLACVRRFRDRIDVSFNSDRADQLTARVCGPQVPDAVVRLVTKLHTKGREIAPHARNVGDLTELAIKFECEPDEVWANSGFPLARIEELALEAMELAANVQSGAVIDGSDMIFLPVRNRWLTGMYDLVVVDEAQDMTTAQLEIAQGVLKPGGRICVVGDDRQAIFGFRGADSESIDRLKRELHAGELGLTTTYRCGRKIVELAQHLVPDFEAGPNNPEGEILELHISSLVNHAGPGDFILSRVNAPLVSTAMKLLRAGKRTRIAGKDIGKGLTALVRRMKGRSVPDFMTKVMNWQEKQIDKLQKLHAEAKNGRKATIESKMEEVRDQAAMLLELAEDAKSVAEIERNIEMLFSDTEGEGVITCSSVHRAKGLEADRVFILEETLRNYNIEEENITYVAITRAKKTLVMVGSNYSTELRERVNYDESEG